MTMDAAAGVIGFICGPAFSAITSLSALQFSFNLGFMTLNINSETSPGFISALFAIGALLCMIPFKDVPKPTGATESPSCLDYFRVYKVSFLGVLVCLFTNFAFTSAFTIFETTGPLYTLANPYLKFDVFDNSVTFAAVAGNALLAIVILQVIMRFVLSSDRLNLIGFSIFVTAGLATLWDWNNGYVTFPRFCVGIFFISFGFTVNQSLVLVVFSKILEGK